MGGSPRSSSPRPSMWSDGSPTCVRSRSAPTTTSSSAGSTSWRRSRRSTTGRGVILLTDMFGGTPSNLAISIMDKGRIEVIAGVNLPMLIKLASVRDSESLERGGGERAGGRAQVHQRRQHPAQGRAGRRAQMSGRPPRPTSRRGQAGAPAPGDDRQPARPARPRRGPVRQDGRAVPRRDRGRQGRHDGLRHLDHGPDDAGCGAGLELEIRARGREAEAALAALAALVESGFDES